MFKSVITAVVLTVAAVSSAQAFEVCSPTFDTGVSAKNSDTYGFVPEVSAGFKFVIGKTNCDQVRAEAQKAQAEARNEKLESIKIERENEEQAIDNMLKLIKAYDALAELCEDGGNEHICNKADALAISIATNN